MPPRSWLSTAIQTRWNIIRFAVNQGLVVPMTLAAFAVTVSSSPPAQAQIIPDTSLPNPSIVTDLDRQLQRIEGGTVAGSNLFHSFAQFNQSGDLAGSTVRFESDVMIANIFARVTGGNGTTIDGLLQTSGNANLYLIDPQGIHFGANARLDIGGAFVATSADRVEFADGTQWPSGSAAALAGGELLTLSIPVGLQFEPRTIVGDTGWDASGSITIAGAGHQQRFFTVDSPASLAILDTLVTRDPSIDRDLLLRLGATIDIVSETSGITTQNTNPIALVGRNIALEGGQIDTSGGAVDLVAIEAGRLAISELIGDWDLDPNDPSSIVLGDIVLREAAVINTSGIGSGSVRLQGQNLTLDDGSVIFARPLGGESGGRVSLEAQGDIQFQGVSPIDGQGSGIIGGTLGPGRGSDIVLTGDTVVIQDGGFLSSTTFASGSGGNTRITARDRFEIAGTNGAEALSVIFSDSAGAGSAGNITIETQQMRVANGAQLNARSQHSGTGGNIRIQATDRVELSGFVTQGGAPFVANISRDTFPSGLFVIVETGATGNAGNIDVLARSLEILGGAQLIANTSGAGNAGNVTIRARDNVSIVGASANGLTRSNVASSIRPGATGNGGILDVETQRFELLDTAFISVTSFGDGRGGSLNVRADTVTVRGASATNELIFGGIFAEVRSPDRISGLGLTGEATGQGGSVTLEATDRVAILDGAAISVLTDTTGNAGNLTLRAATVEIGGVVEIPTASPNNRPFNRASISAGAEELGRGGTLLVDTDRLIVRDGGQITVGTQGSGNAGNLTVIARDSAVVEGIRTITTNGLTLLPSTISASSENTEIGPASGNAGSLDLTVGDLIVRNGGQISVSSDNQGSTGDLQIQAETIAVINGGQITGESVIGDRGNIRITSDTLQLRNQGRIDANATREATGGNVFVVSDTIAVLDASTISANAVAGSGGQINLQTLGLFLAPDSTIEASSQFGLNGIVAIETPDLQTAAGLIELSSSPLDASQLIANACSATRQGGRFTNIGRDGFPENLTSNQRELFNLVTPQPLDAPQTQRLGQSSSPLNPLEAPILSPRPAILEATGWQYDASGQLVLATEPIAPISMPQFDHDRGCTSNPF
ncbi:MAG: filamentous hemagglutinin N-terminal domain-containing protein [Oscillatoriales cyanobacterium]|nr:MAG: filamentous hemagglutinin N-terminal domain-containing protein [Oscillatoriales cyanobacterium]